jgi:hypothetical protein
MMRGHHAASRWQVAMTEWQLAMTEISALKKRLDDLTRNHGRTRNYLVGLTSGIVAALGASLFEQYGRTASNIYTQIIVFVIGFFLVRRITRWTLTD